MVLQQFSVSFAYPVHFARAVFAEDNPLLANVIGRLGEDRRHRVMVLLDQGLSAARPDLAQRCLDYFHARRVSLELVAPPMLLPGGERSKAGWSAVLDVLRQLAAQRLCRHSVVVAVGGGSALDVAGFAAGLFHRGLRLVRVPSSTLAQCDSGVGVKNGIDAFNAKNALGSFAPPFAVLNDLELLDTLPDRYWRGGFAEAWKVALIRDADLFARLDANAERLRQREMAVAEPVLRRTAERHLQHIRDSGDPFESGSSRPLDFGHWSAHALECQSDYALSHGEAVAVGLALDCCLAAERGLLAEQDAGRVVQGLRRTGLPVWSALLEHRDAAGHLAILAGLDAFREHLGGVLTLTLPDAIGSAVDVHAVAPTQIAGAIRRLKQQAGVAS